MVEDLLARSGPVGQSDQVAAFRSVAHHLER